MVLSLAFILAFIGSAVALLIGIIIFSEVQGDMVKTFGDPIQIGNATSQIQTTNTFYACGSNGNSENNLVSLINKADGTTISSNAWSIPAFTFGSEGCNGLAQDPTDLQWYAILQDGASRFLVSVTPSTGVGTVIGVSTGASSGIASMTIGNDGTMYATTGGGNDDVGTINKSTGAYTSQCTMGNTGASINRVAYDYKNDRLFVLQDPDGTFASSISIVTDLTPATCTSTQINEALALLDPAFSPAVRVGHALSMAFHTGDNIFYTWLQNDLDGEEIYAKINPSTAHATFVNNHSGTLSNFKYSVGSSFELQSVVIPAEFQSQVPDSFNQASNIAFTVVAILPVALFFVLFAIFGGRTE